MSNRNLDREGNGPELDNKLIRCVRENPAIYDVNHPHYRRNPVRIAIWERIATELNASSRFLQTKWKNIRYNYLQEKKCLESGLFNANVRKRRFTEDLSFLQNTAQSYNVKKGGGIQNGNSYTSSDTESNSYIYPDGNPTQNVNEVIEIDHSNDSFQNQETQLEEPEAKKFFADSMLNESNEEYEPTPLSIVQGQHKIKPKGMKLMTNGFKSPIPSYNSDEEQSLRLLTPYVQLEDNDKVSITKALNGQLHLSHNNNSHLNNNYAQSLKNVMDKRKETSSAFHTINSCSDSVELYCMSLVDSFRNMSRSERERVKFEFANILKDAKYKDQS